MSLKSSPVSRKSDQLFGVRSNIQCYGGNSDSEILGGIVSLRPKYPYWGIIPIVPSQVSTNRGHPVTGSLVRRSPKA